MTLLERFKAYLSSQFKLVPPGREAAELREEMLGNLMSHAMELKAEGIPDDEVYTRCIEALGDYTEAINALRGKPLQVVRDPKFQRSVLLLVTFSLLCVTAYILMGILGKLWAVGAYTIFPAMAIAIYVFATASVLKRNIRFRKHYTTDLILITYGAILLTALFFVLWLACKVSPAVAWVSFVYIPVWALLSVIFTTMFFRRRKVWLIIWIALVMMTSVAVFLTAAAVTGMWHPLWIIVVVGALACGFASVFALNAKIDKKAKEDEFDK